MLISEYIKTHDNVNDPIVFEYLRIKSYIDYYKMELENYLNKDIKSFEEKLWKNKI